jgi:lipoprotein-releasing system permease protein
MLVGDTMADTLGLRVGDRLAVYSPPALEKMLKSRKKGQKSQEEELVPATDYEVRGIFDAGYYEYNANLVITSLENAQDLYELGDDVDGLMVMLKDPYQADAVKRKLNAALGKNYRITTWNEENTAMQAVLVEKNVMYYTLSFIVIVAAFGITCTLITFVVLKTREIGVLKALGASRRQVMWVFLSQSLAVSVLGVAVGLTAGILAVVYRNNFLHAMRRLTGMELFPQKIYEFSELPAKITPGDLAIICGGSLIICLLAAAFPAWHASRLKPVEALRHE